MKWYFLIMLHCATIESEVVTVEKPMCVITITVNHCPGVTLHVTPTFTTAPIRAPSLESPLPVEQMPEKQSMIRHCEVPTGEPHVRNWRVVWWERIHQTVGAHVPELRTLRTLMQQKMVSARAYVVQHWFELLTRGCALTYVYVNYVLFRLVGYLRAPERWMHWKHEIPLGKLVLLPHDELVRELVICCQARIQNGQPSLLTILSELEAEQVALERYRKLATLIYAFDDIQYRCVQMCEYTMPSWVGGVTAWVFRSALRYVSIRNLMYINDDLMAASAEYLAKVVYLKRVVVETLNTLGTTSEKWSMSIHSHSEA